MNGVSGFDGFVDAAKALSGSPLGIVALFVVFLCGLACIGTAFGGRLSSRERIPLIYSVVLFPFAVLGMFGWLISEHPTSLYAPKDFKDELNYVRIVALISAAKARSAATGEASETVDVTAIISTVGESLQSQSRQAAGGRKHLLWVDDRPENNVLERDAFEAAGFDVTLALSTEQAIGLVAARPYSAIISDMGRKEGPRAGYELLRTLRSSGNSTPFIVYAGSNLPRHEKEALSMGGQGSTNDPNELFRLVTAAAFK